MKQPGKPRARRDSGAQHEPSVNRKARAAHGRAMRAGGRSDTGGSTGQRSKHDR
ncbi:hypothetical protein [Solimonas soli]|uniref:hypothetical protein n=1 Tax=Solimonas soli TaxID=413479 RepID=UPI0004AE44B2|nr:hypothetical protein [Solimonas soli]